MKYTTFHVQQLADRKGKPWQARAKYKDVYGKWKETSKMLPNAKVKHRAEFGIAIDKNYWGIGIGQALTAACISFSNDAGYSQLELEVVSDNEGAISLYRKMGFIEFGRNPRGFISRFQGWQELVSMRLELN